MHFSLKEIHPLTIHELTIPEPLESGKESVVLDCDYDYGEDDKIVLEVKWYFEDSNNIIYQWVAGTEPRVARTTQFENVIDVNYEGHEDAFKKHSALKLDNPTYAHSGVYTCKVSSLFNEDFKTGRLTVYGMDILE